MKVLVEFWKQPAMLYGTLAVVLLLMIGILLSMKKKKKPEEGEYDVQQSCTKSEITSAMKTENVAVTETENTDVMDSESKEKVRAETEAWREEVKASIRVGKVHEQGNRENQQDSFGISAPDDGKLYAQRGFFAVVADGMGGLANGAAMSSLLVRICHNSFYTQSEQTGAAEMLLCMVTEAKRIIEQRMGESGYSGSTLVAAILREGYLHFLTVGDSRIYLYRNKALLQLNREHVYEEELLLDAVNGKMSLEEARMDEQANALTSYLGIGEIPHLDRNREGIKVVDGDKILLASDGIFSTLTTEQIEQALEGSVEEAAGQIQKLIQDAGKKYQDNYTALIIEYQE